MSRKTADFGRLVKYINQPKKKGLYPVFHNLQTDRDDVRKIENEFIENKSFCPKRKNGVYLYHEVISFSGKDRCRLSEDVLYDLVVKYLEMRAPECLAYAKCHFDTDNPHVHLMISANLIKSVKKLRISKGKFQQIKRELEKYQRRKYPALENSIVHECPHPDPFPKGEGESVKRTVKETERERRLRKQGKDRQGKKEQVREAVLNSLAGAYSQGGFEDKLKGFGFKLYRRGNSTGVENAQKRKYRLITLGLALEYERAVKRWQKVNQRAKEIQKIEIEKQRRIWKEISFQEEIFEILADDRGEGENLRKKELRGVIRLKREKAREDLGRCR